MITLPASVRRSKAAIARELLDLHALIQLAGASEDQKQVITFIINLLSLIPKNQPLWTREQIQAHGYTPYERDCVLDALNWLEGTDDLAPSKKFVTRAR